MTNIIQFPGVTIISPKGKEQQDMLNSLADAMSQSIVKSGLPLDDHDALTLMLSDKGYPVGMIAHLMPQSVDLARRALAIAKALDVQILDQRALQ